MAQTLAEPSRSWAGPGVALGSSLFVVAIGMSHGGYFPPAWSWCVLAFAWVAAMALIVAGTLKIGRMELALLGSLLLLAGWTALSIAWSSDVEQSVLEVQRSLVYLVGVLAALLVVRRESIAHLLAGLLAGIFALSAYALATRLFPAPGPSSEEITLGRLVGSIGYRNALGLLAVMGVPPALVFATHARRLAGRAAAASALPVLLVTAYFTYSRGAALALAVGLIASAALERRRLAFVTTSLLLALPAAAALWLAARAPGLTEVRAARALIADEGSQLAIALLVLSAGSAAIVLITATLEVRIRVPPAARRAYAGLLACAALGLVAGAVATQGGPVSLAERGFHGVSGADPVASSEAGVLNERLVSFGNSSRLEHWRVALRAHEQHRWVGSGAGTYEQFWLRYRPQSIPVRDAHSLYLESLAQLGWPGLALVAATLSVPLAAAVRARHEPLVVGAFGAYAAYLVHAGIDWDWEMPLVTLIALLCGVALLAAREDRGAPRATISSGWRIAGVAACLAAALYSASALVANSDLAAATDAVDAGRYRAGESDARSALRWAPWSAEARQLLGRAQVGDGRMKEGRANLREAVRRNSADWQGWYELGLASSGRERRLALLRAAQLNPLDDGIDALRDAGRLPALGASP